MKLVRMTRDMRPYQKNHDALLPDDVAQRLVDQGDADNLRDHPVKVPAGEDLAPAQPAKRYRTK